MFPSPMVRNLALIIPNILFAQSTFLFAQWKQPPSPVVCLLTLLLNTSRHNNKALCTVPSSPLWCVCPGMQDSCHITSMPLTPICLHLTASMLGKKENKMKEKIEGWGLKENDRCSLIKNNIYLAQDLPGGPVAKTPTSQCRGSRFNS